MKNQKVKPLRPTTRPSRKYARLYDRRWSQYSQMVLVSQPICTLCDKPSQVVDHIKPHRGDVYRFWDIENHQVLCKQCHDKKTNTGL